MAAYGELLMATYTAIMGYAEWGSRLALQNSQPVAEVIEQAPVPRWVGSSASISSVNLSGPPPGWRTSSV